MNAVKYEEDSNEIDFSANELLPSFESPSTSSGVYGAPEPKLNLLDGTFFSYLPEKSTANKIVAICMVCRPRHVEVRGYGNCSSNFLSHLKRRHGEETVADYKNYIRCKKSRYLRNSETNPKTSSPVGRTCNSDTIPMSMSMSMSVNNDQEASSFIPQQLNIYSDQLNENIFRFFISAMIPSNAIENPYFIQLLDMHLPTRGQQIMTQHCLEKRIKDNFSVYVSDLKYKLSELDNVCTTIHIWMGEKEHILGVSAHWITQHMQRFSAALACRNIKVRNYNSFRVSQLVREIHEDFGLGSDKLIGIVTGNGSDFLKVFNNFGVQLTNIILCEGLDLEDCVLFDADDVKFSNEIEEKNGETFNAIPLDTNILNVQLKCCSNILISAINDAIYEQLNYANNTALSNIHATTINKCNILWQAAGNPKLNEIIESHILMRLKRPNFLNWTSLNDALQQILAIKDKSSCLHKALNLQNPISDGEFVYLNEYLICTAPIVEALDILQSNSNTFYGIVMPCLFALRRNLLKVAEKTQFYYCKNLINSYTSHVTSSFSEFFDINTEIAQNAAFAALSFPRFKNQWLVCVTPAQRNEILNSFKTIVSKEVNLKNTTADVEVPQKNNRENDFFNFGADNENENSKANIQRSLDIPYRKAEAQILQFFAEDSTDLSILYSYPEIKKIFLKFNTILPSLTIGERLFHLPTINELRRNHKAFNELLEKRIILNSNLNTNQFEN